MWKRDGLGTAFAEYPARIKIGFIDTSTHTQDLLSSSPFTLNHGIILSLKFPLCRTRRQQRNIRVRQPQKLIHKVKPRQPNQSAPFPTITTKQTPTGKEENQDLPITPKKRLRLPSLRGNPQPRGAKRPPLQRLSSNPLQHSLHLIAAGRRNDLGHLLGREQLLAAAARAARARKPGRRFGQRLGHCREGGQVRVGRGPEDVHEVVEGGEEGLGGVVLFDVVQGAEGLWAWVSSESGVTSRRGGGGKRTTWVLPDTIRSLGTEKGRGALRAWRATERRESNVP